MNKIAEMRKQAGLTQSKLSAAIGVSRSTLAMYETNKSEPDFKTISKLADFFGVSVDYLLGRAEKSPAAQDAQPSHVDEFVRDFGDLFADEDFIKYARLYKIMDAAQRIYILGVIVGHLERAGVSIPFTLR